MKFLHWIGNNLTGIAAFGTFVVVVIGQIKHRKHEATSDANNKQIVAIGLALNGSMDARIEEAVKRHVGENLIR